MADLAQLIPEQLGEPAALLERDSSRMRQAEAALGLVRGGLWPSEVAAAVRRTGARIVHAHNVNPSLGWRALEAARWEGARVVLHLHNYRLVCAVGTCFTQGADCTRCHGRNTLPGVRLNCRGGSRAESLAYGAGLAAWQKRLAAHVDAFIVPSAFALQRLHELGAPVHGAAHVVPSVQRSFAERSGAGAGTYVLFAGRLTVEKGVLDAIAAARAAGLPLVIAGDGPAAAQARAAAGSDVRFTGHVDPAELAALRAGAGAAIVPSRYEEILPLAALEAMAAGLPVVATRSGGLPEAVPAAGIAPIGDVDALADRLRALFRSTEAGEAALRRAKRSYAPERVAERLRVVYAG